MAQGHRSFKLWCSARQDVPARGIAFWVLRDWRLSVMEQKVSRGRRNDSVLASFPNQESLNMGHRDSARERFLRLLYKDIHICINPGDTPSEWWFVQPRNNSGLSASWHGLVPIQKQGGAWFCELPTIDVETLPWMIWMQILFQTGNHGGFPHVNVYPRDPSYHQVISYR